MSENAFNIDGLPTVITLMGSFENNSSVDQLKFIKTVLKPLSDGTVCIIDPNDVNLNQYFQQIPLENNTLIFNTDIQNISPETSTFLEHNENSEEKQATTAVSSSTPSDQGAPVYKCTKCTETFTKISAYKKHMISHKNIKKYKCDVCPASYNVETNFKIHMAIHTPGKPTCPICFISFQRIASLKSHLMIHQVEELYNCDECSAEFEKEEELNKHLQSHLNTTPENNSLICSYCKVQFEDQKQYKEHISHHIKVKKMVLSGKKSRKTHVNKQFAHVCNACNKSFSKASLLERHERVHSGERPFICEYCNRGFTQKGTLRIHLIKHKGIKPFQCTLCPAKFNQKGNLRVHVEKTHIAPQSGVNFYKCSHCTCIFRKIASLNIHVTKTHSSNEEMLINQLKDLEEQTSLITPNMYKEILEQNKKALNEIKDGIGSDSTNMTSYVKLAESFSDGTVRRYLVKQRKVGDVRWYICNFCTKEFKKPSDLIRHTRIHTREKPFACKNCNARFTLKSSLFCHTRRHSCSNSVVCNVCYKKFSSIRLLNMHTKKHNQQYECSLCHKIFPTIQKIKLHNREVHNSQTIIEKALSENEEIFEPKSSQKISENLRFICKVCNASFTKMPNLNRHMLLHNVDKKFKCDQCPKSYCTAHALKEHTLCHLGTKNFSCKVCGKRFMTASLLKRHSITHNSEKPFSCSVCNKNFKRAMLCRRHMNIHKKKPDEVEANAENKIFQVALEEKEKLLELPVENFAEDLLFSDKIKVRNDLVTDIQKTGLVEQLPISEQIQQQLYEVSSNPIQIITNSDKDVQDSNSVQTIFINCQDFQLCDNLYPQVKIPNTDTMLFSTNNTLQDGNVFSIDPSAVTDNFDNSVSEIYNTNQIFNLNQIINSNESNQAQSIADLASKLLKASGENSNQILQKEALKPPTEKTNNVILNNINLNDNILTSSGSYYSNSEFSLLFNLESDFGSTNCDLPNENLTLPDLTEVSSLPIEEPKEQIIEDEEDAKTEDFICDQCEKRFPTKDSILKHLHYHNKTSSKLHECSYCGKSFKKHSDLIRHIRTHTGEKPFECDTCDKKFSLKSTLIAHQKTHNAISHKNYNCDVCNSFFTSRSSLKVHMNIHTGAKPHQCNFCRLKFRTSAHRKSHENTHHNSDSKKKHKDKVTNLLESVAMNTDLDQSDQQMSLANNDELINNSLENVLVVRHQDQLQIPGDPSLNILTGDTDPGPITESIQLEPMILSSNFLLPEQFIPSSLIQLDDGTYLNIKTSTELINSEDVKQIDLSSLVVNQEQPSSSTLVVQKPKNLECDVCHKKYASKDVLRKHKKIHTRKYPCSKCERSYDLYEELEKHEKIHLGGRPFACKLCSNCFAKEQGLVTHLKRIHQISEKKRANKK